MFCRPNGEVRKKGKKSKASKKLGKGKGEADKLTDYSDSLLSTDSDEQDVDLDAMSETERAKYIEEKAKRKAEREEKRKTKYGEKYEEMAEKHKK